MIVIFEGPDGCGKSTLLKALAKKRKYRDTYVDRMFVSDIVYATKRKDDFRVYEKKSQLSHFNLEFQPYYVFVRADKEDVIKTLGERKEEIDLEDITSQDSSFENMFRVELNEYPRKIFIDRTNKTVEQCIEEIEHDMIQYEDA